jgi:tetratricopeptide (TPR) repeat protein
VSSGKLESISLPALDHVEPDVRVAIEEATQQALREGTADAYSDAALILHAHTFYRAAAAAYRNAVRLQPDEAAWHYLLGRCYRSLQQTETAVQSFEAAARQAPQSPLPPIRLAEIAIANGQMERAARELDRLDESDREQPLPTFLRAQIAIETDQFERAIQLFEALLEVAPQTSAAHYPLGLAYRAVGRTRDAERSFVLRGDQEPSFEDPWMQQVVVRSGGMRLHQLRATALYQEGNFEAAHAEYLLALESAPESAVILSNLALTKIQLGDETAALPLLERAHTADPSDTFASYNLATLLMRRGEVTRAIQVFDATLRQDGQHVAAATNLGNALCRVGRCDEALPSYEIVLRSGGANTPTIVSFARALGANGRWAEALEALEMAYQRQPGDTAIQVGLARILAAAPEDSIRDGKRAMQIASALAQQTSDMNSLEALAMVAAENGYFDQASQLQRRIVEALDSSDDPRAQSARGVLARYEQSKPNRSPWND